MAPLDLDSQEAAIRLGGGAKAVERQHEKGRLTAREQSDTTVGSQILAGGDLTIRAAGAGADSTITVRGSDVKAQGDTTLAATGVINLEDTSLSSTACTTGS